MFSGQFRKFDKMLNYLTTNYLNPLAKFRPSMWSCYNEISDFQCVENSTNFVESINGALLKFCPRGTISFSKAVEPIHGFKLDAMEKKFQALKNGNMNKQGQETIRKRETTLQIMQLFKTDAILTDPKSLMNFALKFANYDISYIMYE